MLNDLFSSDAVWTVLAAVVLPTIAGIWWFMLSKTSHLYSKLSLVSQDLATKTEKLQNLRHDMKNQRMAIEWHSKELAKLATDLNYVFWELNKKGPNDQGKQTQGPSNRQPPQ